MANWLRTHPGKTGADYLAAKSRGDVTHGGIADAERLARAQKAAAKYGVSVSDWLKLTPQQVKNVAKRYARGKRGAALLEGLL